MSLIDIDHYTDQIRPFCSYLYLHILGEPLLHPQFEEILTLLDRKDFKVQLVTNGTLLNKYPHILEHACLRKLSISLHSISYINVPDAYFITIDKLIEDPKDTTIELRFYETEMISDQLKEYKEKLINKFGIEQTKRKDSFKLKDNVYLYKEELFDWPDISDTVISYEGTCHGGVDMLGINHKGDVTLCCLDPLAYNKLGNLKKDHLSDILSSKTYLNYCEEFRQHKISSELCARCSYRLRFKA